MSSLDQEPSIITEADGLQAVARRLSTEKILGCDLEADSMYHYMEKVCLIQISSTSESIVIDPLAFRDLKPFGELMANPEIIKVFHGADFDIRSLYRDFSIEVHNLFDTMVACQFLGEKELGLAAVIKKRFGVELDKRYQKADWSKRPLDPGMLVYAVADTGLLIELYKQVKEELRQIGRLRWVEEECALLSRVRPAVRADEPMFLRFKGAAKMDPRTLNLLEGLLRFRDKKAERRDLPPFKILSNEVIKEVAERKPKTLQELKDIPTISPKIVERYGEELLTEVRKGFAIPADRLLRYPREPRPPKNAAKDELLKNLKGWREKKAADLGLGEGIIANTALLETLAEAGAAGNANVLGIPSLKNWQKEQFAKEWLALLS